jgi:hypothetical protein
VDVTEIGCEGVDWICLHQEQVQWWAVVNTGMNLWIPQNIGNLLGSGVTSSFSRSSYLVDMNKCIGVRVYLM